MSLIALPGGGIWVPTMHLGSMGNYGSGATDVALLDADLEEFQIIGTVHIVGGGSKTFGTSGSAIGWIAGASNSLGASSVLTVGVKKSSSISNSAGPPARATTGKAAFDVYTDITSAPTNLTWADTAMASGTPFTVTDGDMICVSFFLSVSGASSIKVRSTMASGVMGFPACTLVTASGATFTRLDVFPTVTLKFDDGVFGFITDSWVASNNFTVSSTIGDTNIYGNIMRFAGPVTIDAMAGNVGIASSSANFSFDIYSTPLGTPAQVATIAFDGNQTVIANGTARIHMKRFATPFSPTAGADYAYGIRQTTANAVTTTQQDFSLAGHMEANGLDSTCYAVNSTAGATFAAQNSGKRRYHIWVRISKIDDGAGGAGGGMIVHPGMNGRING